MKTTLRKGIDQERYHKLLLKDSGIKDIGWHVAKKYLRGNLLLVGFWVELIIIIIMVVKK